jgi:hypothetical protein
LVDHGQKPDVVPVQVPLERGFEYLLTQTARCEPNDQSVDLILMFPASR